MISDTNFVGKHILMDSKVKTIFKISNSLNVRQYIEGLTNLINMTLVVPPIVVEFPFANEAIALAKNLKNELPNLKSNVLDTFFNRMERKNKKEAGVSGIAIWAESHTSFHSWPDDFFASFDIYSCNNFDHMKSINYAIQSFDIVNASILIVERYIDIPHKIFTMEVKDGNIITNSATS